jgi:CTP synthase (UTP-ammonia lyase)
VAKLREIGIAPHLIVCRCEKPLEKDLRSKISLFCNVNRSEAVHHGTHAPGGLHTGRSALPAEPSRD